MTRRSRINASVSCQACPPTPATFVAPDSLVRSVLEAIEQAGIAVSRAEGRTRQYSIDAARGDLLQAHSWLTQPGGRVRVLGDALTRLPDRPGRKHARGTLTAGWQRVRKSAPVPDFS